MSWWERRGRRMAACLGGISVLAATPIALSNLPVETVRWSPARILSAISRSGTAPYQGYVESSARLGLPDVPRAGRVLALLGDRTEMRVWWRSSDSWRVDALTPIGERGMYADSAGLWAWDSGGRSATRIRGHPSIHLARPADLLPPELGRHAAAEAKPSEVSAIPGARIAGIAAPGLRITPESSATTIGHIDMWADPVSGLPLRVEITARGGSDPIVSSEFLDFSRDVPQASSLHFEPPSDASVHSTIASDFAQAVDAYSPLVLPPTVDGIRRRSRVANAAGTYGRGFALVAILALPARFSPFDADVLRNVPVVRGPWGIGHMARTPLFNGMVFDRFTQDNGPVQYMVGGTVTPARLEEIAADLTRRAVTVRP